MDSRFSSNTGLCLNRINNSSPKTPLLKTHSRRSLLKGTTNLWETSSEVNPNNKHLTLDSLSKTRWETCNSSHNSNNSNRPTRQVISSSLNIMQEALTWDTITMLSNRTTTLADNSNLQLLKAPHSICSAE